MSEKTKTSTTVSGRGLNKRTTVSTTTIDDNGNTFTRTKTSRSVGEKIGSGVGVFCLIVGILLIVSLVRSLIDSDPITFRGFLETLISAPTIDMSLKSFEVITPLGDWGIFNFLSTFFNYFITIFNVLIFVFKGLYQVAIYFAWLLKFIFV